MEFRKRLDIHLKRYPFIPSDMFNGEKSAYGMFLFQVAEFLEYNHEVISEFLNVRNYFSYHESCPSPELVDFVVLWGVSDVDENTLNLFEYAECHNKPIVIIEDGFIRSFFPMSYGEISASMRFDAEGCYYDSNYPSAIENLLNSDFELSESERFNIRNLISLIVSSNITKYNLSKTYDSERLYESTVLVIDQVYGDMSIKVGGTKDSDFDDMLKTAIEENPNSLVLVKLHPESVLGIRKGHYENKKIQSNKIQFLNEDINPLSIIKCVDKVYCATTQMGFEALLSGKQVICFGKPFYAGWGLTSDRKKISRRSRLRSIEDLFYAAYIYNTIYVNPNTKKKCCIRDVIDYINSNKNNEVFLQKLRNDFLEIRIKRLERKVLDIDPLKDTSLKFENAISKRPPS